MTKHFFFFFFLVFVCLSQHVTEGVYVVVDKTSGGIHPIDVRSYFQHPPAEGTYLQWPQNLMDDSSCTTEADTVHDMATNIYSIPAWGISTEDYGEHGGVSIVVDIDNFDFFSRSVFASGEVWNEPTGTSVQSDCATLTNRLQYFVGTELGSRVSSNPNRMEVSLDGATLTIFCKTRLTALAAAQCAAKDNRGCDSNQASGYFPCDQSTFFSLRQLSDGSGSVFGNHRR